LPASPNRSEKNAHKFGYFDFRLSGFGVLLTGLRPLLHSARFQMRFVSAILAIGIFAGLEFNLRAELADAIKVVVHDSLVTYEQVDDYTAPLVPDLRRQIADDPAGFQKKINGLLDENTQTLVDNELILHEYESAGYKLPENIIDKYVQQRIQSRYGDRATLTRTLHSEGITYEKFYKRTRDQFIIEQMRLKNVSQAILISPHKIEVYYAAHTNDFRVEDQVKLRMIVLNKTSENPDQTKNLADEILGKIAGGASFAEMASIYSQDSKRSEGGQWDWFETSKLRKELADAAVNLKPGEHSGVIDTPEACYIMLVEEKRSAHIKPLADVRDEIENKLMNEDTDRLQKEWLERLRKKTFVRYLVAD
jgi:parvulin-like peptidyl-prolyl isomerase